MEKYLPDPFAIAGIISLVVVATAIFITRTGPIEVVNYWGQGFFDIPAFSMQMKLVIVTGYALASARIVRRFLQAIARIPRTPLADPLFHWSHFNGSLLPEPGIGFDRSGQSPTLF